MHMDWLARNEKDLIINFRIFNQLFIAAAAVTHRVVCFAASAHHFDSTSRDKAFPRGNPLARHLIEINEINEIWVNNPT